MSAIERDRPAGNRSGLEHDRGVDDQSIAPGTDIVVMWRRRRQASWRLEPLQCCGCADPWPCHCHDQPPSAKMIDAGAQAAEHLLDAGVLPLFDIDTQRQLWRGGHHRLVHRLRSAYGLAS